MNVNQSNLVTEVSAFESKIYICSNSLITIAT